MDMAYDRGVQMHQAENSSPTPQKDKKLSLNLNVAQTELLSSVLCGHPASKDIDQCPPTLSAAEEEKAMGRIVRALRMLERDKMNQTRIHLSEMEHTRK